MDRKTVGLKLKALRLAKGFSPAEFRRRTGIHYPQIQSTEEGTHFPRLDLLKKWLDACGTTMSAFFLNIEKEGGTPHRDIDIIPGFEEYYDDLNRIIRSESKYYIQGIESNLKALATAAEVDSSKSKAEKADHGNISLKEKKRTSRKAS